MGPCVTCYLDRQKDEWKQEKYNTALAAATKLAQDEEKTVALWKEGSGWKYGDPAAAGAATSVQYISVDNDHSP